MEIEETWIEGNDCWLEEICCRLAASDDDGGGGAEGEGGCCSHPADEPRTILAGSEYSYR